MEIFEEESTFKEVITECGDTSTPKQTIKSKKRTLPIDLFVTSTYMYVHCSFILLGRKSVNEQLKDELSDYYVPSTTRRKSKK